MKRFITLLLSVFTTVISRSQLSKAADLPPLMSKLAQSKVDTARIHLYIDLAEFYLSLERVTTRMDSMALYLKKAQDLNHVFHIVAFQNRIGLLTGIRHTILNPSADGSIIFLPVIDSCKRTGDKKNEADAWMWLGLQGGWDSVSIKFRLGCLQNSILLVRELHNDNMEIMLILNIALLHTHQLKFDMAERELFQALKEEEKAGPVGIMTANYLLSDLYAFKSEYDKALRYVLIALQIMENSGDSSLARNIFAQLSFLYQTLGMPVESLQWDKKALDYDMAVYITGTYDKVDNIGRRLRTLGKNQEALDFIQGVVNKKKLTEINDQRIIQRALGNTYNALNRYDLAEKSYNDMIRLGNLQTDNYTVAEKGTDNSMMGTFYFKRGLYKKAHIFLTTSLDNFIVHGQFAFIKIIQEKLFKTDSALGDYVEAIRHLKESNRLGDSIFNIARNKQIEELQITYKTEQNAKDFRLLQGKEQLGQVQLQSTKNTRNWIIAGASLLFIIAGLLYRLASLRKKKNLIIRKQNGQLKDLVTEKEWLLKEVHHRVKNNLHTVIGLLESQAANLQDDALKANEISKHRIYAMSLIHQQLYNTDDIKTIDMSVYLPELMDYLGESFGTGRNIRFQLGITPLKLGVGQAIPIGLIVNEAVTNSIKYAFRPGTEGSISITMDQRSDKINLCIADNGIGMDPAITGAKSTSMGLKLIRGLTRDIDGEINFASENGTRIEINFKADPLTDISTLSKYN